MKMAFANLTEQQKTFIESATFDRMIVTRQQAEETAKALELEGKGYEELTAIRNAVVKHLADAASAKRDAGDWALHDQLTTSISAITAVIDNRIYAA